jgi:hypothetical protein
VKVGEKPAALKSRSRRAKKLFNELSKIALSWRFQVVSPRERQAVIARHQGVRLTYGELKAAVGWCVASRYSSQAIEAA